MKLRNEINSSKSEKEKVAKRKERNATLKEIHQKIEEEENNKIIKQVEDIEQYKDDSRRMYRVVKELQRKEPKKKILVDSEHGITTNKKIKTEIVKKFFQDQIHNEKREMRREVKAVKMQRAFTSTEIEKAVKRLKTGKSAGTDELNSELIKYGPETICEGIAEIYNNMAETGKFQTEVKEGVLIPLPKPGKKPGPPGHL